MTPTPDPAQRVAAAIEEMTPGPRLRPWLATGPAAALAEHAPALLSELAELRAAKDAAVREAQIHAQEARTQRATVEAVGALFGLKDYEDIAGRVAELRAERDRAERLKAERDALFALKVDVGNALGTYASPPFPDGIRALKADLDALRAWQTEAVKALERAREIEHRAWHVMDDMEDRDDVDQQLLGLLLTEAHPGEGDANDMTPTIAALASAPSRPQPEPQR